MLLTVIVIIEITVFSNLSRAEIYDLFYLFIHFVTHIKDIHLHRDITITITRE
jgi:hypothetical protein